MVLVLCLLAGRSPRPPVRSLGGRLALSDDGRISAIGAVYHVAIAAVVLAGVGGCHDFGIAVAASAGDLDSHEVSVEHGVGCGPVDVV